MEEMNAKVMENEELEDITEAEEAEESGSAGALVAGVVGGFLAYAMIGGSEGCGASSAPSWLSARPRRRLRPRWWTRSAPKSLRRIPTRKTLKSNRARGSPKGEYLKQGAFPFFIFGKEKP